MSFEDAINSKYEKLAKSIIEILNNRTADLHQEPGYVDVVIRATDIPYIADEILALFGDEGWIKDRSKSQAKRLKELIGSFGDEVV